MTDTKLPRHYDDVHQTTVFRTYNGTATAPYTMRGVATANRQYVTKHRLKPTSRPAYVLTFPFLPKRKKDVRCNTPYHEKLSPAGQDRLFRHARLTIWRDKTVCLTALTWLFETTKGSIHDPQTSCFAYRKTLFRPPSSITHYQSIAYTNLKFRAQRSAKQCPVISNACIPHFNNS